jgi:CheY-like chemotaxis protein
MVETYRGYFELFASNDVAAPAIAQSYNDAKRLLAGRQVFQLVVLDLRLPNEAGSEAEEASTLGLSLIKLLAERDHAPIPVLMVVTGDPNRIHKLQPLADQLKSDFWHGTVHKKSLDLQQDLEAGISKAREYTDLGILVADDSDEARPLLTAREEDLLRRAALKNDAASVDLRWWSSPRRHASRPGPSADWLKVLEGEFLLPHDGRSQNYFFKFESIGSAERSHSATKRLANKLPHVKVAGFYGSHSRGLLVTNKAGPSLARPQRIESLLRGDTTRVDSSVERIVTDIGDQLARFDKSAKQETSLGRLAWNPPAARRGELLTNATKAMRKDYDLAFSPTEMWEWFIALEDTVWLERRPQHGDLHIENVSLDEDGGVVRAYVIDAGAIEEACCGRDLAVLEVSCVLHQSYEPGESLVHAAAPLFDGTSPAGVDVASLNLQGHRRNVVTFVDKLRRRALSECTPRAYAFMLLDVILGQVGGFAFGTTRNRVVHSIDAIDLLRLITRWLRPNARTE